MKHNVMGSLFRAGASANAPGNIANVSLIMYAKEQLSRYNLKNVVFNEILISECRKSFCSSLLASRERDNLPTEEEVFITESLAFKNKQLTL